MYRAYIAQQKYRVVLDEIKASNTTPLLALRWLAEYFTAPSNGREDIIQKFEDKLANEDVNDLDQIWLIVTATVYYNENLNENVLK
jgi:coatomer subunit epsilon